MVRWVLHQIWEKLNIVNTYREIKALGKKYGRRFFFAALIWEGIEDIFFPFISWKLGVPELIPVFLVLHFEPIIYPVFFWGFKTYDRLQGKEPWEPERSAQSTHSRSVIKGLLFQLSVLGWLCQIMPWKSLIAFAVLTSLFGFVHERIWHDTNYGIREDDMVQVKRTIAKTATYLLIAGITLYPLLRVGKVAHLWQTLLMAQGLMGLWYLVLESVWSKSTWGVNPTK